MLPLLTLLPAPAQGQGASARLVFDGADRALNQGQGYTTTDNKYGLVAWGEAPLMMGYAAMFRATGEVGYLVKLAEHASSVLAQRDSIKGRKDHAGRSRPCWQATWYSVGKEPYCWVVHTGMITYPMADLALLVQQHPQLGAVPVAGRGTLAQVAKEVLAGVIQSVAVHEAQFRTGPAAGEGYYEGDPKAASVVPEVAAKTLPMNMSNAMGRTYLTLWKVTGDSKQLTRARALASYLRNRMKASDEAYVWTYSGSAWTKKGQGEDIAHASINVDFAALCQQHGVLFSAADIKRLGRTLLDNVHRDSTTVADKVDGADDGSKRRFAVGRWLNLTPQEPRAWAVAANIYQGLTQTNDGSQLLGLALLALHAPARREHALVAADWKDLGAFAEALVSDARFLLRPTGKSAAHALLLQYRAGQPVTAQQWDGSLYHHSLKLAATSGSSLATAWVPYHPGLFHDHGNGAALMRLSGAKGLQLRHAAAVKPPQISTPTPPPGAVGLPYRLTLQGSGDPPLLWSLVQGPASASLGLQTGVLAWTPTVGTGSPVTFVVRLTNDAGRAAQTLQVTVAGAGPDAGPQNPDGAVTQPSAEGSLCVVAPPTPVPGLAWVLLLWLLWYGRGAGR